MIQLPIRELSRNPSQTPMSETGSITAWIHQVRAGDREAVQSLWDRYFPRLVNLARQKLDGRLPTRMADEEDVALSVFKSVLLGTEQGRFPQLNNRDDLWRLLLTLTARKAAHQVRDEFRAKRGGGRVNAESDLPATDAEGEAALAQVIGSEPTPQFAAQVAEEYRRLLDKLGNDDLRSIAVWQMEGDTVEEIARKLGRSERTVARKLTVIRDLWSEEGLS